MGMIRLNPIGADLIDFVQEDGMSFTIVEVFQVGQFLIATTLEQNPLWAETVAFHIPKGLYVDKPHFYEVTAEDGESDLACKVRDIRVGKRRRLPERWTVLRPATGEDVPGPVAPDPEHLPDDGRTDG